ncbi:hypothetical protein EJ03DRAFT_177553 [Teratosphaeria nubilosa]|uniref:Uncharacterized protein n=1 Tax=Teratosphaeria nubilosa TaxID=161662 RepID=A0A6G1L0I7_9PEZI|nr:hypothetical protein EJ03DRAFT_177553 [Teratosphaeria nubilosa]
MWTMIMRSFWENPSWNQLRYKWDIRTKQNTRDDFQKGLQTLKLHSERDKSVKCAECGVSAQGHTEELKVRVMNFLPAVEHASARAWRRMVWTLQCELDGRRVFAIMRCEKQRRLGAPLYTFWKATGGYTSDAGVVTIIRNVTDGVPLGGFVEHIMPRSAGKRRRSESSDHGVHSNARAPDEELAAPRMNDDAYVDLVADDEDRESLWQPSPPFAKVAKRDASGRFKPAQISSRASSVEKELHNSEHQRDTTPVSSQPRVRPHQPQPIRPEHHPPHVSAGTPLPAALEPPASPQSARPLLIRVRLQIKGKPMTYTIDLHDETVTDFFATIAHKPPFRQVIGRPTRIASVIMSVHDRDEEFMHWGDAHADAAFEEMLCDARKLAESVVDRKVVLRGEIELKEQR